MDITGVPKLGKTPVTKPGIPLPDDKVDALKAAALAIQVILKCKI